MKTESGNWNDAPRRTIRRGITQATLCMSSAAFTCTFGEVENDAAVRPHEHPHEQFAVCLSGKCDYIVDGTPYKLTAGGWVLIPSGVQHYVHVYETEVPCRLLEVYTPKRPDYDEAYQSFLVESGFIREKD